NTNQPMNTPVNIPSNMPPSMPPAEPKKSGLTGAIVVTVIVLALIIIGALYFWNNRNMSTDATADTNASASELNSINTQSNSDSAASIQEDLNNTDTNNVDQSLNV